ncbi:GntR family transcriptional regulator [Selenomonas montiformis]|uniref:GntR family transcriptional regulator n=1 Tax=Selenomonas montiformis TaxID=2652285 RepID=UPI0039F53294
MLKYQAIAEDIRQKITQGTYQPDDQLPLTSELEKIYHASKMTIKRALDHLESEGLIVKRRGSGTFVKGLAMNDLDKLIRHSRSQLFGMSKVYAGHAVTSKVRVFEIVTAPKEVKTQLRLNHETFVYRIVRVRLLDGTPFSLETSYMPIFLIPNLRRRHAEQSIFSYIRDSLHLKIQSAHRIVRVRGANSQESAELHIASDSPVAVVQETYFLASGLPFNYSITTHEPKHFALETIIID